MSQNPAQATALDAAPPAAAPEQAPQSPETKRFGRAYWMLNTIEMWERLAYYAVRTVVPLYIAQADDPGGLHLTQGHKGIIYAWWALVQSLLPTVTGGFADRYGYKKTMAVSIGMNMTGYLMMAYLRSYEGFFAGVIVLAAGTALFKPSIQGSLAQNLNKANSSLGWGIFYWVVNIGGFIGPVLATVLLGSPHTAEAWQRLFLWSAGFTSLNFLMLLTFKDVPSGASKTDGALTVLWRTLTNLFEPRLITWLLIMSCFWLMMYQLWDLHPNFITDWVDSAPVASFFAGIPFLTGWAMETDRGLQVPQQILLNFNAFMIIVLVVPVSWLVRRMRTLSAMLIGMVLATVGILVAGLTGNVVFLLFGILFFSLGEMLTGPKKNEYLGLIAPPGKKGLYLGYVNIPVGIGVGVGSWLAGQVYGHYGEKAVLALKYLATHAGVGVQPWDGRLGTLESAVGVTRMEAFARLQEVTGLDPHQATQLLWDTYHPQLYVWLPFAGIGVVAVIALGIFGQMAKRWSDMNA